MLETAFIGFLVSGAFLGLANFDLFYQLIACTIILKILVRRELALYQLNQPGHLPSLAVREAR